MSARDSLIKRQPNIAVPLVEQVVSQSQLAGQLHERHALTAETHCDVLARVIRLFYARGPSAILFAIRTIVVNAVKRRARWLWPHIRKEHGEVLPSRIVGDAATAVPVVFAVAAVVAALLHSGPRVVGRGALHAVRGASCTDVISVQATATRTFAIAQRNAEHLAHRAARAAAKVIDGLRSGRPLENLPLAERLADEINVGHDTVIVAQWLHKWERRVYGGRGISPGCP